MKIISIIPARMGSSRFPGKPLALINNVPMIGHVYNRVSSAKILNKTVVATCDTEIATYIESINGQAIMTSKDHERASDRCAEALLHVEKEDGIKYDLVVMVQGDEPMTSPDMIEDAINPMIKDESIQVANLLGKIKNEEEFEDRNCIKVVCDKYSNALYFSREPIPTRFKSNVVPMGKQVCIIPFRRDFLISYTSWEETPLESIESIDMMRILENGFKVKMIPTKGISFAVDTINDLKRVESIMGEEFLKK